MNEKLDFDRLSARTEPWGIAALRVVVGLTFLMHGWKKLFDMGIPGTTAFFGDLGVPAPMLAAAGVSALELVGGAALLAGLLTRWVAIPLAFDMLAAIVLFHLPQGFFASEGGYEHVLLLLVSLVALALTGSGAFALDRFVGQPRPSTAPVGGQLEAIAGSRPNWAGCSPSSSSRGNPEADPPLLRTRSGGTSVLLPDARRLCATDTQGIDNR
jgi:putative oxidoreductase